MCFELEITFDFVSVYLNIEDACGCINIFNVDTVRCSSCEGCGSFIFPAEYLSATFNLNMA